MGFLSEQLYSSEPPVRSTAQQTSWFWSYKTKRLKQKTQPTPPGLSVIWNHEVCGTLVGQWWKVVNCVSTSAGKESDCNAGDPSLIPWSGRSPGEGLDNPLQYSCLENPHGQKSQAGCSPWSSKELDTTEWLSMPKNGSLTLIQNPISSWMP